jgi:hypothetical protein
MKKLKNNKHEKRKDWPVVVYMWVFGLTIMSYMVARIILDAKPHPYHWLSAIIGGLAGIPIGWLWYRWRGDVM